MSVAGLRPKAGHRSTAVYAHSTACPAHPGSGYTDDKIDRIPLLNNSFRTAGAVKKNEAAQQWTQRRATLARAEKLWLDGRARISLDQSVPMVGAPAAWEAGFDGTGVTVAVLDSGCDQQYLRALNEAKTETAPPLVALHRVTELVIEIKFSHRLIVDVVNGAHGACTST